jgi:hypothetical protein
VALEVKGADARAHGLPALSVRPAGADAVAALGAALGAMLSAGRAPAAVVLLLDAADALGLGAAVDALGAAGAPLAAAAIATVTVAPPRKGAWAAGEDDDVESGGGVVLDGRSDAVDFLEMLAQ